MKLIHVVLKVYETALRCPCYISNNQTKETDSYLGRFG